MMSPAVTHRDNRWFKEPDVFNPDRWADANDIERPKFAYFPFGGGSRVCIGETFAWMDLVLLVTTISQRWRLTLAPNAVVQPQPVITLRPKPGLLMTLASRNK
jgi:cytochrome P450